MYERSNRAKGAMEDVPAVRGRDDCQPRREPAMKMTFAPFSLISGLLAGVAASKLFELVWGRFANQEAPEPDQRQVAWPALVVAMLLEGAIARVTRGLVDRGTRVAFQRITGSWPGDETRDEK